MSLIEGMQRNPEKYKSGVETKKSGDYNYQKKMDPQLFLSPSITTPTAKGSDKQSFNIGIKDAVDIKDGQARDVHKQLELKVNIETKAPEPQTKKLKFPPKVAQMLDSEVIDQETERFNYGMEESKVAQMIESQVTYADDGDLLKEPGFIHTSELHKNEETIKYQPKQSKEKEKDSEAIKRNVMGVDGEMFDSMI